MCMSLCLFYVCVFVYVCVYESVCVVCVLYVCVSVSLCVVCVCISVYVFSSIFWCLVLESKPLLLVFSS